MNLYDINDYQPDPAIPDPDPLTTAKDRLLSSFLARGLFFLLLIVDLLWGILSLIGYLSALLFGSLTKSFRKRRLLGIKRASVGAISLFTAIFSPSIGILFGCTYFMFFDKEGINDVIPSSLRSQFETFFPSHLSQ